MCGIAEAGLALTALSMVAGAVGQYQQGQNAQAQANYQAKLSERNAQAAEMRASDAEYRGVVERQQIALQEGDMLAQGRTAYAAGNVQLGSGSPVDWEVDLAQRAEGDKRTSRYNASVAAWGERVNASDARAQAGLYRASGSNAARSGLTGAGGSLLAGAGTVADRYYTYNK